MREGRKETERKLSCCCFLIFVVVVVVVDDDDDDNIMMAIESVLLAPKKPSLARK